MATYAELYELTNGESSLRNKVTTACLIAAKTVMGESFGLRRYSRTQRLRLSACSGRW